MKKLAIFILLIIIVSSSFGSEVKLTKEEQSFINSNPIIKVHNELNWPPFNYSKNGQAQGYSIDFMNLIAKKAGLKVEYISGPTWNEFLDMMKNKELDVMLNIVKTPERQKYLLYTPPYANNPNAIISKNDKLYESIESLSGKIVALPKGFFTQEVIERNYPNVKLLLVNDTLESMKAVSFGKADAALGELAVINHFLSEHMMTDLTVSGEAKMGNPEYSLLNIATRKDLFTLQSILSKGVDSISIDEKKSLQRKWLVNESVNNKTILTKEEIDYLSKKDYITMCVDPNWMPFEKIEKHNYKGIGSDVIKIVSKKIDKQIELVETKTWDETLDSFESKKCDIIPIIMETHKRKKMMNFTKPYMDKFLVVATKNEQFLIQDSSDLNNKKIGIVSGYVYKELLKEKSNNIDIVYVKNARDGLRRVQKGELFGFVDLLPAVAYIIQKDGMLDLKIAGRLEYDVKLSIGSQKDKPLLNSIMQKALDDIEQDQIDTIIGKWISIKVEQSFDYRILIYVVLTFLIIVIIILIKNRSIKKINDELKIAKQNLDNQLDFTRTLLDTVPNIICVKNRDNRFFTFNTAYENAFGIKRENYIGKNALDLDYIPLEARKHFHKQDEGLMQSGGEVHYELPITFADGTEHTTLYWSKAVKLNNKVVGIICILVDISNQKDLEKKLLVEKQKAEDVAKILERISTIDALTNIYNRRHFNDVFPRFINSAKRNYELVSFLIIDIDYFKQYNDTFGHQKGDEVLKKVSAVIQGSLHRADDLCFRLGGEEFGVIFKTDTKQKAFTFANKIRQNIEDLKIEHPKNSASSYVTASMGLICKNAKDIISGDEIYKDGDDLLYKAKENGRNRVEYIL